MAFNQWSIKQDFIFFIWLGLFACLLLLTYSVVISEQKSATGLLLILVTCLVAFKLVRSHMSSKQRLKTVLKALANDDPTLGLSSQDPLIDEFNRVRKQLHRSRQEIQAQHQFLQTLLVQMDSGILVLDQSNHLLHKNPALERLLGILPGQIEHPDWGQLGEFILSSEDSSRCVLPWLQGAHKDILSIRISCFNIQSQPMRIISVQSIYQALQAKEQQAYKKLTKVLTHEIANSIMPLASLAETCNLLIPKSQTFDSMEDRDDLAQALSTINKRASYLDQFVRRFVETSRLPEPDLARIELKELVNRVLALLSNSLREQGVEVEFNPAQNEYWLMADAGLLEQVIVNLIKNAIESLHKSEIKQIKIDISFNQFSQLFVDIQDSGPGVELLAQEQIFVPFFTTKQQGSGIGLSLSRQIMVNHGGDLVYIDHPKSLNALSGACFRLVFG